MNITSDTKISTLINANPASIEAIASINKHFEKLRNPILRKILASRITIADASKIGGCTIDDFFKKLLPLGFVVSSYPVKATNDTLPAAARPDFMQKINTDNIITLDVRDHLASGKDPFQKIIQTLASMPSESILLLINTFEPIPLINILKKKGFEYYTEAQDSNTIYTYLKNTGNKTLKGLRDTEPPAARSVDFAKTVEKYKSKMKEIDVRSLEMPLPMITILHELEVLPEGYALFVNHKKIPQFLLPELKEKNFCWLIDDAGEGDIKLLIFR